MPDATSYGMKNGQSSHGSNGDSHRRPNAEPSGISEKQLDLINRIVRENNANKGEVERIAVSMFGNGVRALNRMQASNLIDELFERYPRKNGNGEGKPPRKQLRT